ncbi:MAG: TIM barrel protein [Rhizobiaceae bacterium]
MLFSANLGFLWTELPLPAAIEAARYAGFDAVEFHWPYAFSTAEIEAALQATGMPAVSLNTQPGNIEAGDFGLAALADRRSEALAAIDEAVEFASAIKARAVHVMCGKATGPLASQTFLENLERACKLTAPLGLEVLIEPINSFDVPGYFLSDTQQAIAIIDELGLGNLRLMFDCYHVARQEGDVSGRFKACAPYVGHVQFAGIPDRGRPDEGLFDYSTLFAALESMGYDRPIGAEYRPSGPTLQSLGWLPRFRQGLFVR